MKLSILLPKLLAEDSTVKKDINKNLQLGDISHWKYAPGPMAFQQSMKECNVALWQNLPWWLRQ